ncbi:MAG: 50S ribosomal protein L21 [Candidatus Fibromonas sp.]|jgi:large subunit ribosomal protein L21|nr:50S ribosomal protein L21 [Candidatus Fibromonas sp.]
MYSIVETGGFQYRAEIGKTLKVPSVAEAAVGSVLELKSVLLFADGESISVGTPVLENASVKVEVLSHDKADKVFAVKKKRRTRYERHFGHRQGYTEVLVVEIEVAGKSVAIDPQVAVRQRARIAALAKQKEQAKPLTRKEKIAADIAAGRQPKPVRKKKFLKVAKEN